MDVTVDFYAGYRDDETPRRLQVGSKTVMIALVVDRWVEPGHRYFRLRGVDGLVYVIGSDEANDRWELVQPSAV